jgi:hypothetical protein
MLTGRFNFQRTLTGKIVLRVEEHTSSFWSRKGDLKKRWRNATLMDLTSTELRGLMDLRMKPHSGVEVSVAPPRPMSGSGENVVPLKEHG